MDEQFYAMKIYQESGNNATKNEAFSQRLIVSKDETQKIKINLIF